MKFNNPYWDDKTKMQLLEKWIIIHSIIYYELDTNIVSDQVFNANCDQLINLSVADPKGFIKTKYYYTFEDFDGSTGFHLYKNLSIEDQVKLMSEAVWVVKMFGKCK